MMDSEDGHVFIKNLAQFVRTHERAIANALQLQRQPSRRGQPSGGGGGGGSASSSFSSTSTAATIAAALSLPYLNFTSANSLKPVKLTLTPHHLFYLLSRFEDLNVPVGPMNVRLESLHSDSPPAEYVSFLSQAQRKKVRGSDRDSIHSVSSLRSVMSGMSSFWSNFGLLSKSTGKTEKQKLAIKEDLRYLYSAFTKIPCLKLSPDHQAPYIAGWEEFPFDTAVPLFAFKNLSALEVCDVDFRQFYGWDRMADQLRSLTVKRAHLDDPADLLVNIVIDDMDKRRRKATKPPGSPGTPLPSLSPRTRQAELTRYSSETDATSPTVSNRRVSCDELRRFTDGSDGSPARRPSVRTRPRSASPTRPSSQRGSSHPNRSSMSQLRRGSGSSGSSMRSTPNTPRGSTPSLLSSAMLPSSKWRFLRHLSIADNGLTSLPATSLSPLATTLQSLDLSSNLFTEIPDSLASLVSLRALNLSNCMIDSLHSLLRNPLPAVTTLNLRHNRLASLAGIERLPPLERVDFRDNRLADPTEMARLTGLPEIREIFVNRNPFTKTHSGYRVTILNLFRNTPGYVEDIVLDANPASYSERKMLIDRVPEPAAVPVVKVPVEEEPISRLPAVVSMPPAVLQKSAAMSEGVRRGQAAQSQPSAGYYVASHRKRKGARRVVELSKPDDLVAADFAEMSLAVQSPRSPRATEDVFDAAGPPKLQPKPDPQPPREAEISTSERLALLPPLNLDPGRPDSVRLPARTMSDVPVGGGGDVYKQKIESLRNDLGPAWLSAFTDERWDAASPAAGALQRAAPVPPLGPPPVMPVRTHSQGIVAAGRTLG